eukprot:COSAG06_NODE_17875_length_916_cov_1.642595_1_plen_50_part_10
MVAEGGTGCTGVVEGRSGVGQQAAETERHQQAAQREGRRERESKVNLPAS